MVSKVEDFRLNLLGKEIIPASIAKDRGVSPESYDHNAYNEGLPHVKYSFV